MNELLIHYTKEEFRKEVKNLIAETIRANNPEKETTNENEFLTRQETAKKFHISLPTLHRLTKDGTLKSYKIGGRVLIKSAELNEALTERNLKFRR